MKICNTRQEKQEEYGYQDQWLNEHEGRFEIVVNLKGKNGHLFSFKTHGSHNLPQLKEETITFLYRKNGDELTPRLHTIKEAIKTMKTMLVM